MCMGYRFREEVLTLRQAGQSSTPMSAYLWTLQAYNSRVSRWTTITQLTSLNTPGYANGLLYLWANNTLALAQTGLVWRTQESVTISKIMFSTFFGGSDDSWDSQGGRSYFRNFEVRSEKLSLHLLLALILLVTFASQVYAGQSSSNTSGPAVNATLSATSTADKLSPWRTTEISLLLSLLLLFCISIVS